MKRKSVFILTAISPETHRDGHKWHYLKDSQGNFKCNETVIGVFSSVLSAENAIRKLVEIKEYENSKWDSWETYFGFVLDEHYVDNVFYGENLQNVSYFESKRSYLSNGKLNYFSDCDDRCEKKFNGTSKVSQYVSKNDFALVHCNEVLVPVLIGELPFTKEEWKKRFKAGVYGDYTDDSGVAFTAYEGHWHPFGPTVFPMSCLPHAKNNKKVIQKINKEKKNYYEN